MDILTNTYDCILSTYPIQSLCSYYQYSPILAIIAIFGFLRITKFILKSLCEFISYFPCKKNLMKEYGPGWAVVTGASEGIGFEYSKALAEEGFNVVMIARRLEVLKKSQSFIEDKYKVKVLPISFDFNIPFSMEAYGGLISQLKSLEIAILVNNVGVLYVDHYEDQYVEEIQKSLRVNMEPVTYLTRLLLPKMLQRKGKSAIMNLSSYMGHGVNPYFTIYGATKSYVRIMTECIALEYTGKIDILAIKPGGVSTTMLILSYFLSAAIPAEKAARSHIKFIGKTRSTFGHWKHLLLAWTSKLKFADFIKIKILYNSMLQSRKKR